MAGWSFMDWLRGNQEDFRDTVSATEAGLGAPTEGVPADMGQGPMQGPSMEDYKRYRLQLAQSSTPASLSSVPYNINSPQAAADRATSPVTTGGGQPFYPQKYPEKFEDWTFGDKVRNLFDPNGSEIYRNSLGTDENTPAQTVIPGTPANVPIPTPRPSIMDENAPPPQTIIDGDTTSAPVDPISDIQRQKAMIDAIYPQRPPQDIGQGAVDAEVDKDRQRMQYMAQLALFSGITQGAGGQWEGVGRGLASAGQAYSAGFDRYQKALQGRANRAQDQANQRYTDETNRSDAAVKLYSANATREDKQRTNARLEEKDRQNNIDEYFKQRLGLAKADEFNPQDPGTIDKILKEWRMSRDRGEIVSTQDVSDK